MARIEDGHRSATGRPSNAGRAIIENIVLLTAPRWRVWSVLMDFANHRRWKPYFQLAGDPVGGGEATYTFRIAGFGKPITAKADILRVEKPAVFAWAAGVANLLVLEESYELESDAGGTRLRHSLRFQGFLSKTWAALLRRKFHATLVESDACLERHLRRLSAQPTGKSLPQPPRQGGKKPGRHR